MLIGHSQHRVLSALSLGPERYACRVSIRPSEASLRCLPCTATVDVGQRVRIFSDGQLVKRCFDFVQYEYSELMDAMCGEAFEVVCHARDNCGTTIVGLPSPDGSQDGVWYFPVTVLEREAGEELGAELVETGVETGEEAEEREEAPPAAVEHSFRWELRRQSDHAISFDLGDMIVHARYGYRGVIVGFDDACMQTDEWTDAMGVDKLPQGRDQPFYHVLVDERDRPGHQVTYVAQENAIRAAADGEFPGEPLRHSLVTSLLQPGSFDEARCRYKPLPQLRAIYPPDVDGCWMVDAVIADGPADND